MWKFSEKQPFFRADMAGLGKYCTGGYGRIGVYRVKTSNCTKAKINKLDRQIIMSSSVAMEFHSGGVGSYIT